MPTATHYENANFLRELAESLPRILPKGNPARQSCCNGWPTRSWPGTARRLGANQNRSSPCRHKADHPAFRGGLPPGARYARLRDASH
jgi:hypothetical protein